MPFVVRQCVNAGDKTVLPHFSRAQSRPLPPKPLGNQGLPALLGRHTIRWFWIHVGGFKSFRFDLLCVPESASLETGELAPNDTA
jgi:hypothetical protein